VVIADHVSRPGLDGRGFVIVSHQSRSPSQGAILSARRSARSARRFARRKIPSAIRSRIRVSQEALKPVNAVSEFLKLVSGRGLNGSTDTAYLRARIADGLKFFGSDQARSAVPEVERTAVSESGTSGRAPDLCLDAVASRDRLSEQP